MIVTLAVANVYVKAIIVEVDYVRNILKVNENRGEFQEVFLHGRRNRKQR